MKIILKDIQFLNRFAIAVTFSLLLLMIRIITVGSEFFLFLVWNLFLACIPYVITILLSFKRMLENHIIFWLGFITWLLFLPNSPYIITDLQHLRISTLNSIWFDVLLIISFAINGLLIGFASLKNMQNILHKRFTAQVTAIIIYCTLFLCGFGIYLGRVLRWNSWDIIENPLEIIADISNRIIHPIEYTHTWAFTFGFGGFLMITFHLIQYYQK